MVFGDNLKTTILKTIEAFGKSASSMAEGAQKKLSEMNLEVRRRELTDRITGIVMELYHSGTELPESLTAVLDEINGIDAQLAEMRAEKTAAQPEETEEEEEESLETAEEVSETVAVAEEMTEETETAAEESEASDNT